MRATFIFSVAAAIVVQGANAYVQLGGFADPGVLRRADAFGMGGLLRREPLNCSKDEELCGSQCSAQCCDAKSGLSCRTGQYCVIVNGAVGCCPEGKTCNAVKSCLDYSTKGCEKGGTHKGALCCAKEVPHCNKFGQTQYCEAAENATVNGTLTMIENSSTTSCHLPQATQNFNGTRLNATHTNTTSLPTITKQSELSNLPITNLTETTSVESRNSVPTVEPSNMGDRKDSSITVILGGLMIAFVGALCL
ncbi:hypothetical protein DFH27DRAFT_291317 [Peziza echinospora]|nr:hypothetical protein DFH27DRAFT_291317 [Peziza echinospora]